MKKILYSLLFTIISLSAYSQNKKIDPRLIGSWAGSEKDDQVEGISKSWIMNRNEDGTFELHFTTIENGVTDKFSEKGKWWIDSEGIFHEYHANSKKTDTYIYEVLDKNTIRFKSKSLSVSMENSYYEFIDTRVSK